MSITQLCLPPQKPATVYTNNRHTDPRLDNTLHHLCAKSQEGIGPVCPLSLSADTLDCKPAIVDTANTGALGMTGECCAHLPFDLVPRIGYYSMIVSTIRLRT